MNHNQISRLSTLVSSNYLILVCVFCLVQAGWAQENVPIPEWIKEDWAFRAADDGKWITDNAAYKNERETFDAYGINWYYGPGKNSFKGSMYGYKDGIESDVLWEFFEYWDPANKNWVLTQYNGGGMVGIGTQWVDSLGQYVSKQHFSDPSGLEFIAGHRAWAEGDSLHTQSYDIDDEEWKKRRYYLWLRKYADSDTPEYWKGLSFLIGEWEVDLGNPGYAKMIFKWGENKRLINYKSLNPAPRNIKNKTEAEGVIVYDGVADNWRFTNAYMDKGDNLIAVGNYTILEDGRIERKFTCHYAQGETLPWSDGAKVAQGGKEVVFKQVWTVIDTTTIHGKFYTLKNGEWVSPNPESEGRVYIWKKVR